jgi:hypothetical protein
MMGFEKGIDRDGQDRQDGKRVGLQLDFFRSIFILSILSILFESTLGIQTALFVRDS